MINPFNSMKVLCWRDRIDTILEGDIPSPVAVEIDPSNLCTQNCVWCMFKDFKQRERVSLDPAIMDDLIADLGEFGVKAITFTGGGEPLVNPATPGAMRRASEFGMQVGLVTNGDMLEREDVFKSISENCRYVRLSIDAGSDGTYFRFKQPRNRDQLTRNLESMRRLVDMGFSGDVGAAFLIHPNTYRELPILVSRLEDIGASYLQVRPCIGVEFTPAMINFSRDVVESYRGKLNIYANFKRFDEIRYGMDFQKCRATPLLGIVGADAKMYLCCQFRGNSDYIIGDLKEKPFSEQWGGEIHRKAIERIDLSMCPPCRYSTFNHIIEKVFIDDRMHRNFL